MSEWRRVYMHADSCREGCQGCWSLPDHLRPVSRYSTTFTGTQIIHVHVGRVQVFRPVVYSGTALRSPDCSVINYCCQSCDARLTDSHNVHRQFRLSYGEFTHQTIQNVHIKLLHMQKPLQRNNYFSHWLLPGTARFTYRLNCQQSYKIC
jgi:hypothetical protein